MATKQFTTIAELDAALKAKKITVEDYFSLKDTLPTTERKTASRAVKMNKSGGVYVMDPAMPQCLNVPIGSLRVLVSEPTLLDQIKTYLAEGNAAQREKDQREAQEKAAEREAKKAAKRK